MAGKRCCCSCLRTRGSVASSAHSLSNRQPNCFGPPRCNSDTHKVCMRYPKGTIIVSRTRDVPLLERVLHCGFATREQLFEFLQLDRLERSRPAFEQRMRRLEKHDLIRRHSGLLNGHEWVYSITPKGACLL